MLKRFLYALMVIIGVVTLSLSIDYFSSKLYLPSQFLNFSRAITEVVSKNNSIISEEIKQLKEVYPNISIQNNIFVEPAIEQSLFLLEQRAWYNPINPFGFLKGIFKSRDIISIESGVSVEEQETNQIVIRSTDFANEFEYYNEEFKEQDYRTSICFSEDVVNDYTEQNLLFSVIAYSKKTGKATYSVYVDDQVKEKQQLCYWFDTTLLEDLEDYRFYVRLFNMSEGIDVFVPVSSY